jgi:hypothetical protein
MGTAPSLQLTTLVPDRETISIASKLHPDGRLYELRKRDELGVADLQEIGSLGERAEAMLLEADNNVINLSAENARLLEDWVKRMHELIFHTAVEPEVFDALTFEQRLAVVQVFTEVSLPSPNRETRRAAPAKKRKPTGGK